jgi:signal transduction histidine kinase
MSNLRVFLYRAAFVAVSMLVFPVSLGAQPTGEGARVLVLYGHDDTAPIVVAFTNGLREVMRTEGTGLVQFHNELLDFERFPGEERKAQLAAFLGDKYREFQFDAIVTEGSLALQFAVEQLGDLFPDVPIVYALAFEPVVDLDALPANVTGVRQPLTYAGTLTLAKRLQPDAERVILIAGVSAFDSLLYASAVSDLTPLLGNLELVTMRDWTYPTLLSQLPQLPPRSIGILSSFSADQQGLRFNSGDLIASVTRASSIPMYGISRNWVGDGIVGGSVMTFGEEGVLTGRLLMRILERGPGEPLPAAEVVVSPLVVDWRQLEQWGLSEARLPPETEVLLRTPTVWERYWPVILGALALIIAQSALIAMQLLERRRRRLAQRAAEESRNQLAHFARVAIVGELATAISHELRQPLAAILSRAETGARLLAQPKPDVREAREIFEDIVDDDARAAEVLDNIRTLLRKEEPVKTLVDINEVCQRAIKLLEHDAQLRGVHLRLSLATALPPVSGDAVQLMQVILNLTLNALEAVHTSLRAQEVTVGTSAGSGEVEIFVRDTGPGLAPQAKQRVFEPFFSTKAQGLGMGLTIVRTIVDRHHGRVRAENDTTGAVFRVLLPAAGLVGIAGRA